MTALVKRILVPIDGSDGSLHATRFAAHLAAAMSAELILLHVAQFSSEELLGVASITRETFQKRLQERAEPHFRHAAETIGLVEAPILIKRIVEFGHASDEIVACAKSQKADMIVIGSRGLSPLSELLLGSVSEKVVRRAHCPVTVVR